MTQIPTPDRISGLRAPLIIAWINVGFYVTAGILFANNYGWERAFRIYTGFNLLTKGWYEDALIRPGMFWCSVAVALLLTRRVRSSR